ncbi:MAG: hypothetical protein JWN46_346 [Acidimicrobiales bacterium]|nr:hypothetical protein [Acidimicrobiales bacterium]
MLGGVAGLLLVWAAVCGLLLLRARSEADRALSRLERARAAVDPTELLAPATDLRLEQARHGFASARSTLRNPLLSPLRLLPVVGRQIRAGDHLTGASTRMTTTAQAALADLHRLTAAPVPVGPGRVRVVRQLAALTATARQRLAGIDPGSGTGLIGPLHRAHDRLLKAKVDASEGLDRARAVAEAVARLLDGPSHELLLAANNAEMRAGGGMYLSAAPVDIGGGRLRLGEVRPTQTLVLPAGTVPVTGDVARNWSWLGDPGRDLRNLALTPDFPTSAAQARRMWPHVPQAQPVDGVIVVDVDGVRGLLRVVGPVVVEGQRYTADNVREQLLHQQYQLFPTDRAARRDRLGAVARVVFDRLERGGWKLERLASELLDAVQSRHLLVWSADPVQQRAWARVGMDGHLTERSLAVSVLNRGANKLDQFLPVTATLTTRVLDRGATDVTVSIQLANETPAGEPRYITGPNAPGLVAGRYAGIVSLDVPPSATGLRLDGGRYLTMRGRDGPSATIGAYVLLDRGQRMTLTARFTLPAEVRSLVIEPAARAPTLRWTVDGKTYERDRRRTIEW